MLHHNLIDNSSFDCLSRFDRPFDCWRMSDPSADIDSLADSPLALGCFDQLLDCFDHLLECCRLVGVIFWVKANDQS